MLTLSIAFSVAVLLTSVAAQDGARVPGCSSQQEQAYIAALPNAEACDQAFSDVLLPVNLTEAEYSMALRTLCSVDCGGAIAEFSVSNCRNVGFAATLYLFCLPRETGEGYCRSIFPDVLENGPALITELASCSIDGECSPTCANALMSVVDRFGCCNQNIYNDTDVVNAFVQEGLLSAQDGQVIQAISQSSLWDGCSVNLTTPCTGNPFPGTTQLGIGACTERQFNSFVFSLGETCVDNFSAAFGTNPPESILNAGLCLQECGGEVSSFFGNTCLDPFTSLSTATNCFRTEGELGPRCFYSVGPTVISSDFFTEVETTCFADGPCPSGCQEALQEVKEQLGCCYQNIYNNSLTIDSLFILDMISDDKRDFFISLGVQELWESCGVSLQPQCTGDPYDAAPATTAPATTAPALKLITSTMMMLCMVGISFIGYF